MRPLAAVVTLCFATGALASPSTSRYLIALRHPAHQAQLHILRDSDDFRDHEARVFAAIDAFAASLSADEAAQLRRSPEVRYVSPVVERHASQETVLRPSAAGSAFSTAQITPWNIPLVHADELWRMTKGNVVNVAVLDTGIDRGHPDLAANVAGGYNTFAVNDDPNDDAGHGTHVAGIVAALDNGIGVVGVAPQARIWPVKVLDKTGYGSDENIVAGIDWVLQKKHEIGGPWIISLSLGSQYVSAPEEEALERGMSEGIIVVAAAGNRGFWDVEYPAGYPGVIAVGAVDSTQRIAPFSDGGSKLSLVAPGVQVLSTTIRGTVPAAALTIDNGMSLDATLIRGSGRGELIGKPVVCGTGKPEDFPLEVAGRVAVIKRGDITFNQKVRNAQAAGASGVIIYNSDASDFRNWTLIQPGCDLTSGCDDLTHPWPVVLAISAADGQLLLDNADRVIDAASWLDDYVTLTGTSMACPHVSGAIALIWSLSPESTADRVREAIIGTAVDLGPPGFDFMYGYGLVDAYAAARRLAPWRFGIAGAPPSGRRHPALP